MITVKTIGQAVRTMFALKEDAGRHFICNNEYEDTEDVAREMIVGLTWQNDIHFTEAANFLCIEDQEYRNLLNNFKKKITEGQKLVELGYKMGNFSDHDSEFKDIRFYNKYVMCYRKLKNITEKTYAFRYGQKGKNG